MKKYTTSIVLIIASFVCAYTAAQIQNSSVLVGWFVMASALCGSCGFVGIIFINARKNY